MFVFVMLVAGSRTAEACSCMMSNNCGALAASDAVFEATVDRIDDGTSRTRAASGAEIIYLGGDRTIVLKDVRAYRGTAPATIVTGSGGGDCGYPFVAGKRYLIQAYRQPDGRFSTGICGFTRPVEGNAALIDYLKSFDGPATQTRLIGSIRTVSAWKTYEREFAPVAGKRVTIIGPRTLTVTTDVNGEFVVFNLPPGTYRVEPDIRQSRGYRPVAFTWQPTDAYACEEADFIEPPDGRVSGTILDENGKPVPNAFLYLRPADQPDAARRGEAGMGMSTDDEGRFEFEDLPPGSYTVGIAPDLKQITLGLGEHLDVGPLRQRR
jgi:hypothetical protein